jgi:hypothetical protein
LNAVAGIFLAAIIMLSIWGLVVLLSNPVVQAVLFLFGVGGFLVMMKRVSE